MLKRRLWMMFSLLAAGVALTVQAQDAQPITQPTVDAAVSTLIAQTQQTTQQISATRTIQAALGQALTATAQAIPTATPAPLNAANVTVVSTTEVDLMAGPGATSAFLAPNGERFAYRNSSSLCIYQGAVRQNCVELPRELNSLEPESIRWSPDSRTLVFTENFFQRFVDADIWVWDTTTDAVADLTDDGANRLDVTSDTWKNVDVLPEWLSDGRIVFLRHSRVRGNFQPPALYAIAPDGSGLEKLGSIETAEPLAIFALDAAGDRLLYDHYAPNGSPSNGIWSSNLDGSDAQLILSADEDHPPLGIHLSPDGRYALTPTRTFDFFSYTPADSPMRAVDMASGTMLLIDSERYVLGAGWSPDGSMLAYLTYDPLQPERNGLYVTSAPGSVGRRVLAGRFNQPTSLQRQTLTWAANNTLLLSRSPERGIVLVQLGN